MAKHTPTPEADAALAEKLGIDPNPIQGLDEKFAELDQEKTGTTIADNLAQMNNLIVAERRRTRLSETTIVKTMELTMNYHVWSTQRDEARAAQMQSQSFDPAMYLPQADEEISEADDNVIPVNFTPDTEEKES